MIIFESTFIFIFHRNIMGSENRKRYTIYDVAAKAGVSITTVSRYINKPDSVHPSTADKIREAMEIFDYIPTGNAGKAANHEVRRVGVMTPFFPAPSFVQRLEGMLPVFRESNYEMIVYTIENADQLEEYIRSVPFTRRIDGLVIMSISLDLEQRRAILLSGLPTVSIETEDPGFSTVVSDNVTGGRLAAQLILRKGYLPAAFLGDDPPHSYSLQPSQSRLEGYRAELTAGGFRLDDSLIFVCETKVESAKAKAMEILKGTDRPRAIFAMSDIQAIGVFKAAQDLGLRMPEDFALIGFDNIEASGWMGLSTIDQHLTESGRISAMTLVDRMKDPSRPIQAVQLGVSVVERRTT
jgi:DNA-binding LacI/PurR family transcriptional regulator